MIRTLPLAAALALLLPAAAAAQAPAPQTPAPQTPAPQTPVAPAASKEIRAVRIQGRAPVLDGRLDDEAWAAAPVLSDFLQKQPVEGGAPTERTEVRFAYDDAALYVAARMYKNAGSSIQAPVGRRDDGGKAEHIWISLDTYLDRRTAYSFGVTAAGTRMDWYHATDDETDTDMSFDPVWQAETQRDSAGWTAEMRIPFSQLRFAAAGAQTWGLNIDRWNPATQEDVFWIPIPSQVTAWASRMGTLSGIEGIRPSRRAELLPYVASSGTFTADPGAGNPFDDGSRLDTRVGADFKMGMGPNLTLEGTVNPDFGQVEADPAEVNLSAYESYFGERRPFFIEGRQLLAGAGPEYFYSRRIGSIPDRSLATLSPSGDFEDWPRNTAILGAAKLTGRLRTGTSIGALAAVTGDASARGFDAGTEEFARIQVAPRTGYGVLRAQQEFGAHQSTAGFLLTGVHRDMDAESPLVPLLHRDALAGGGDWNLRFRGGEYAVSGYAGFSYVSGDSLALRRTQRSSAHYFQRPDADHVRYRSRESLGGYTGEVAVRRASGRHWLWTLLASGRSPGFEINDAGFAGRADEAFGYANLRYRETKPGDVFRSYDIGLSSENTWNFGGTRTFSAVRTDMRFTWKNFWTTTLIGWVDLRSTSDSYTRGGPLAGTPQGWRVTLSSGMPGSWRTRASAQVSVGGGEEGARYLLGYTSFSTRPGPRWQFSVEPLWRRMTEPRQYVATLPGGPSATYGNRYTFASVDQTIFSAATRLNYLFTPDLSLEFYMEPFAANGRYESFGQLREPGGLGLLELGTDQVVSEDGRHDFCTGQDADGDGATDRLRIAEDFNIRSFRSNAVLRWEWRPGSTLFVVWQRDRFSREIYGDDVGLGALSETFGDRGDNYLTLKMSYWIPVR
ncbi:MAG TPA: DUF5916 domain-containing protein [Longimicrobium sp.]|nr:DUF5916 domain-containing protein [Longimicrobium sp.]